MSSTDTLNGASQGKGYTPMQVAPATKEVVRDLAERLQLTHAQVLDVAVRRLQTQTTEQVETPEQRMRRLAEGV